jgi:hypothetical protein
MKKMKNIGLSNDDITKQNIKHKKKLKIINFNIDNPYKTNNTTFNPDILESSLFCSSKNDIDGIIRTTREWMEESLRLLYEESIKNTSDEAILPIHDIDYINHYNEAVIRKKMILIHTVCFFERFITLLEKKDNLVSKNMLILMNACRATNFTKSNRSTFEGKCILSDKDLTLCGGLSIKNRNNSSRHLFCVCNDYIPFINAMGFFFEFENILERKKFNVYGDNEVIQKGNFCDTFIQSYLVIYDILSKIIL